MGDYTATFGASSAPPEGARPAFWADGPPGRAISEYHLRSFKDSLGNKCAPECADYGACSTTTVPLVSVADCDSPTAPHAKHLVHQPGKCRCRDEDGNWERSR